MYCFIDFQPNDNDAVYYFTVKIAFAISLTMKGVYHAFFDPTNTYAEKNCVKNHKKELLALGSRAFVITGHSSSKKMVRLTMLSLF